MMLTFKFSLNNLFDVLNFAREIIVICLRLKKRRVTFLCGDPGVLAIAAVVFDRVQENDERVSDSFETV